MNEFPKQLIITNDMSNPQTIASCIKRAVEYAKQCQQKGLLVNTNTQNFDKLQEQSVRDLETIHSIHSLYADDCIHTHRTDEILEALMAEFPDHA
jgi:NAD-dependent SIR2 family protein deacetylase